MFNLSSVGQFGINPMVSQSLGLDESTAPAPAPASTPAAVPAAAGIETAKLMAAGVMALAVAGSIGASAYHGYKRNNSAGWAAMWGFMAFLFPVVTPAVGIAQGWGKREKK